MTGPYAIKPLGFSSDWLHVQGVATPFLCSRGSSTPFFLQWQGVALHFFQRPRINPGQVWPWLLTSWPSNVTILCPCPADHLCQLTSKSIHLFSNFIVFTSLVTDGRTERWTNRHVENIMSLFASLDWRKHKIMIFNTLMGTDNYSATLNNVKLVHWPLMGGLLHLVQWGVAWAGHASLYQM